MQGEGRVRPVAYLRDGNLTGSLSPITHAKETQDRKRSELDRDGATYRAE
jgi:hypothetical protein